MGTFGWTPRQRSVLPQPLYVGLVDVEAALQASATVLRFWNAYAPMAEHAPALSGGVLDSWPAWLVDGFGICKAEVERVRLFTQGEEAARG